MVKGWAEGSWASKLPAEGALLEGGEEGFGGSESIFILAMKLFYVSKNISELSLFGFWGSKKLYLRKGALTHHAFHAISRSVLNFLLSYQ